MYKTINNSGFHDAFHRMDRKENFSYEGLNALFEYLEEIETYSHQIELDVISLCCDYSEYSSATECAKEYGIEGNTDYDEEEDEEAKEKYFLESLHDRTAVIIFDGGIIIQKF